MTVNKKKENCLAQDSPMYWLKKKENYYVLSKIIIKYSISLSGGWATKL